jgi:hypothetical protein
MNTKTKAGHTKHTQRLPSQQDAPVGDGRVAHGLEALLTLCVRQQPEPARQLTRAVW